MQSARPADWPPLYIKRGWVRQACAFVYSLNAGRYGLPEMNRDLKSALLLRIRVWLVLFIVGLVLSGLTAFPLVHETAWLDHMFHVAPTAPAGGEAALQTWLRRVHNALEETGREYPFMAYGTDWLAFAHLVIAVAFIGPLIDPVRNKWVLVFGVIACLGVFPLALIAGAIRGIPLYWRAIDCCFGLLGAIPLFICLRDVRRLEKMA
jgi:hypothetical protein